MIVTYLTKGLSWKCDYVATLSEDDKYMDITSWVTLTNNTDMTFENTKLKLVAGDVNQVTPSYNKYVEYEYLSLSVAYDAAFVEKSFADYHLYTMQHATTIKSNQTKQVELFSAKKVPVTKTYELSSYDSKVKAYVEFDNKEAYGLGLPMPKGIFRVSKADTDGGLEFIGEDSIDHTAKDENVKLLLGNAFDVTATRTLVNSVSIGSNMHEETYEIVIKNHKDTAVEVIVTENPGSWYNWTVITSSMNYEKINASSFKFVPTIEADESLTIKYTVRLTW